MFVCGVYFAIHPVKLLLNFLIIEQLFISLFVHPHLSDKYTLRLFCLSEQSTHDPALNGK